MSRKFSKKSGLILALLVALAACLFGVTLLNAAPPSVPYGGNNGAFPKVILDYYNENLIDIITDYKWTSPIYDGKHGSSERGEEAWTTTHEELMDFIKGLPTTFMRWDVIGNVTTYDIPTTGGEGDRGPIKNFEFPLVVFSNPPVFEATELRALNKPIFYIEGQIHGNEPSAGEGILMVMEKLAIDDWDILDKISVVVMPRYNVDGAFWNTRGTFTIRGEGYNDPRRGPQGLDMNREHTVFQSPITRMQATILNTYRPEMGVDMHEMGWTTERGEERYVSTDLKTMLAYNPPAQPDAATGKTKSVLRHKYYRYSLWNPIDLGNRFMNLPSEISRLNLEMQQWVQGELLDKHGIYSFPYYMSAAQGNRETDVQIVSGDQILWVSGDINEVYVGVECAPDEGYGDGSMGLKGMIELCAEVPAGGKPLADGYKARAYSHYAGVQYMMKWLANATNNFTGENRVLQSVTQARQQMAQLSTNFYGPLHLWHKQNPYSPSTRYPNQPNDANKLTPSVDVLALRLNASRDEVEDIDKITFGLYYDNLNLESLMDVDWAQAYIIDGTVEVDGKKINPDAVAFRLGYIGIPVMRLTAPVTVEVEGHTVQEILHITDDSFAFGYSGSYDILPNHAPKSTDFAWKPGSNYRGNWDTAGGFGNMTHLINKVLTKPETKTFPAGSYVIPTNHVAGLHASLTLEPLGNRNFGNNFMTWSKPAYEPYASPLQYWEHFFPIKEGSKFPAYRYFLNAAETLPLERVFTEQPFMEGAVYAQGYPLNLPLLREKGFNLTLNHVDMGYYFKAQGITLDEPNPVATAFKLFVPSARENVTFTNWLAYNWEKKSFENVDVVTPTGARGSKYINVTAEYISPESDVLVITGDSKTLTGVTVDETVTLDVTDAYQLTVATEPANATGPFAYAYTSSNPSVLDVDENGNLLPRAQGTATVTVTVTGALNSVSATCEVTVTDKRGDQTSTEVADVSVAIDGVTHSAVDKGNGNYLFTLPYGTDVSALPVKFTLTGHQDATSNPASGTLQDFTNGHVSYVITSANGQHTRTIVVSVVDEETFPITGITLNEASKTIKVNDSSFVIVPTVEPDNATGPINYTYTSTNSAVAGVDASGKVLPAAPGTAMINVTATGPFNTVTAQCAITVTTVSGVDSAEVSNLAVVVGGTSIPALKQNNNWFVEVPYGTNVNSLVVNYSLIDTEATGTPANGAAQNFSSGPVAYKVTSSSGQHTNSFQVTVHVSDPNVVSRTLVDADGNEWVLIAARNADGSYSVAIEAPAAAGITEIPDDFFAEISALYNVSISMERDEDGNLDLFITGTAADLAALQALVIEYIDFWYDGDATRYVQTFSPAITYGSIGVKAVDGDGGSSSSGCSTGVGGMLLLASMAAFVAKRRK